MLRFGLQEFHLAFVLGCSLGVLLCMIYQELIGYGINANLQIEHSFDWNQEFSYLRDGYHEPLPPIPSVSEHGPIIFNDLDSLHYKGGDRIAKELSRKVRVLCWVMTQPKTLYTKAQAVRDTWGKRCNVLVFFSSQEDKRFPAIGLDVPEGRQYLWLKTKAAWKYVYDKHRDDADWFIKTDDDSYVILENLRYFLSQHNSSKPHYFGRHFSPYGGYNSGGAGYVFSKETLIRFARVMRHPTRCKLKSGAEDKEVGVCLAAAGVYPGETRDEYGRETFHPFSPDYHLIPGAIPQGNWLYKYNKWEVVLGPECCSDHTISFHYITPNRMYLMEYFIYHLHAFGVHHVHD